jgi:hypothetical protein
MRFKEQSEEAPVPAKCSCAVARLVRLVPTREVVQTPGGLIQCLEAVQPVPVPESRLMDLWRQHQAVVAFSRALEAEHGIR